MRLRVSGLQSAYLQIIYNMALASVLSIHVLKLATILNHLKCINWYLKLNAARISSATLLYKMRNWTENVVFWTNASSQNAWNG